jgi:hypothetical protein
MSCCERCNARIPTGRHFCHPHYLEALRDYERDLERYQQDRQAWEQLPPEARRQQDDHAEAVEVTMFAFFQGLALGGLAWYAIQRLYPIDGLIGLLILGAITAASMTWRPLTLFLGRLTRALVYATPKLLASTAMVLVLGVVSAWVGRHWQELALGLGATILMTALVREAIGLHHSSGEPVAPVETRP